MKIFRSLVVAACAAGACLTAAAQAYPQQPIKVILPFTAGGGTDGVTRIITEPLGKALGQTVVIDYKAGANTIIGAQTVAAARPDGYTLLATKDMTATILPSVYSKLPFDPLKDLVPVAMEVFDRLMPQPNQIASKKRDDVRVGAADLLRFEPEQPITEKGLRLNINVAIQYIGAWLAGQGAVPIFNLMEDAATAEISRSQVWQWIRSPKGTLDDGRKVTKELVATLLPEELGGIRKLLGAAYADGQYDEAARIFADLVNNDTFVEFLTLPSYERID